MIVVDASALAEILLQTPLSQTLVADVGDHEIHAAHLIDYEFLSVIRGLTLGGAITVSNARDVLADFDALPIRRWPATAAFRDRAYSLRHNLSAYDATYVALAEALDCALLTVDARIQRASGHQAKVIVRSHDPS